MPRMEKIDARDEERSRPRPARGGMTQQDALQLQRLAGNRTTTELLSGGAARDAVVMQRYTEQKLPVGPNSPSSSFLFSKRVEQNDATSGVHNYAMVLGTFDWAKSTSNRHAEIKLLLGLQPQRGAQYMFVSEFKPCAACKKDMEEYEQRHGVTITVFYLIDYVGTGDGDKVRLREFYKALGKLDGGGDYVYRVLAS